MFESDGSSDEYGSSIKSHVFKTKQDVPLKIWAQYFVAPEKDKNASLTKIFQTEFIRLKGMYVFLDENQVMGKTLTKLGIPNTFGKVNKKVLMTVLKPRNKPRSGRYNLQKPYRPCPKRIFKSKSSGETVKHRYFPVAERWSDIALKKFKVISDLKSSPECYGFDADDEKSVFEDKIKHLDVSKHEDARLNRDLPSISCKKSNNKEELFFEDTLKLTDVSKHNYAHLNRELQYILSKTNNSKVKSLQKEVNVIKSKTNKTKENSNTSSTDVVINEPVNKFNLNITSDRITVKKSVRFNDNDLCEFAPFQVFKDASQNDFTRQSKVNESAFDKLLNEVTESYSNLLEKPSTKEKTPHSKKDNVISTLPTSTSTQKSSDIVSTKADVKLQQPTPQAFEIEPYTTEQVLIEDWSDLSSVSQEDANKQEKTNISMNECENLNEGTNPKPNIDQKSSNHIQFDVQHISKFENKKDEYNSNKISNASQFTDIQKDGSIIVEETPSNSEHSHEKEQPSHQVVTKNQSIHSSTLMKVCFNTHGGYHSSSSEKYSPRVTQDQEENLKTLNKYQFNNDNIFKKSQPSNPDNAIKVTTTNLHISTNNQITEQYDNESKNLDIQSPSSDRDYISNSSEYESEQESCTKTKTNDYTANKKTH